MSELFVELNNGQQEDGWLLNLRKSSIIINDTETSAVELYFITPDRRRFRTTYPVYPYFYVLAKEGAS
ncbi:MAG: hypothetical protein EZS28_007337 [Streblomastix strix]|uniref:Uncharacterized protein n=1 Tax=Streblomastix strix TaxID=222440 RepID=A0A5J4WRF3_9EUKA|nr:MAG: hypothetical protein EZS28_007337 [Streblomastix strix]